MNSPESGETKVIPSYIPITDHSEQFMKNYHYSIVYYLLPRFKAESESQSESRMRSAFCASQPVTQVPL